MRTAPTTRTKVNKAKSARKFSKHARTTKAANLNPKGGTVSAGPMRGGIRL